MPTLSGRPRPAGVWGPPWLCPHRVLSPSRPKGHESLSSDRGLEFLFALGLAWPTPSTAVMPGLLLWPSLRPERGRSTWCGLGGSPPAPCRDAWPGLLPLAAPPWGLLRSQGLVPGCDLTITLALFPGRLAPGLRQLGSFVHGGSAVLANWRSCFWLKQ